jgi:hypothetical protein
VEEVLADGVNEVGGGKLQEKQEDDADKQEGDADKQEGDADKADQDGEPQEEDDAEQPQDPNILFAARLACHPPLFRYLPDSCAGAWVDLNRPYWAEYTRASTNGDLEECHRIIKNLLSLPSLALIRKRSNVGRLRSQITKLVHEVDKQAADLTLPALCLRSARVPLDEVVRRIRRCIAFVYNGYVSKGVQVLLQEPIAEPTKEVIAKLEQLHPAASDAIPDVPPGAIAPLAVDVKALKDLLKKQCRNGSSPGVTGWTGELMAHLADDDICIKGLASLVRDIIKGCLPSDTRTLLLSCTLYAGRKRNSDGVRPLAPGEPFIKLADLYALSLVQRALPDVLDPTEFGVGQSGGSERAVHIINSRLRLVQDGEPRILISTDFTNAFNARRRSHVVAEFFSYPELSSLFNYVHWLMDGTSPLFCMWDGRVKATILSREGMRQGGVMSSALFAVSMHKTWNDTINGSASTSAVTVLDDCNLVGPAPSTFAAFDRLKSIANEQKLPLNLAKCRLLWPYDEPVPESVASSCIDHGLTVHRRTMSVLGAQAGWDQRSLREFVLNEAGQHGRLFDAIRHAEMPPQIALLLLQWCARPKMNYIARVTDPDASQDGLKEFDNNMLDAARAKLETLSPVLDVEDHILAMPVSSGFGGFGLFRTAPIAHAAYWASFSLAVPNIAKEVRSRPDWSLRVQPLLRGLRRVFIHLRDHGVGTGGDLLIDPTTADYWSSLADRPVAKFQKRLCEEVWLHLRSAAAAKKLKLQVEHKGVYKYKRLNRDHTTARLVAIQTPLANQWLITPPLTDQDGGTWKLKDEEYLLACRLRAGQQPQDDMPKLCSCGFELAKLPSHLISCKKLLRRSITVRHNFIVAALAGFCTNIGGYVEAKEPPLNPAAGLHAYDKRDRKSAAGDVKDDKLRVDLKVEFAGNTYWVDVSVVNPTTDTEVTTKRAFSELASAVQREKDKVSQYEHVVKALGAGHHFVPFVLDAFGGFGPAAKKFCKGLATRKVDTQPHLVFGQVFISLVRSIAFALQRGNARILTEGLHMLRIAKPPRLPVPAPGKAKAGKAKAGKAKAGHGSGSGLSLGPRLTDLFAAPASRAPSAKKTTTVPKLSVSVVTRRSAVVTGLERVVIAPTASPGHPPPRMKSHLKSLTRDSVAKETKEHADAVRCSTSNTYSALAVNDDDDELTEFD